MNTPSQRRTFFVLLALLALTVLTPIAIRLRNRDAAAREASLEVARSSGLPATGRAVDRRLGVLPASIPPGSGRRSPIGGNRALSPLGIKIREILGGLDPDTARPGELLVVFDSAETYQRFVADPANVEVPVTGRIPELAAVRLTPGTTASDEAVDSMARALEPLADAIIDLSPNGKMFLAVPSRYEQAPIPLVTSVQALLGLPGQASGGRQTFAWGTSIMIAVLDTGISSEAVSARTTRGRDPRLTGVLDAGWGNDAVDLHGSGVAALLGWVSPGARILGVRVTDAEGVADVFTVAQGLVSSLNVGANLVSISPASLEPAALLSGAVALAARRGATVIASTAGDRGTWPAADPAVIGVGSIISRRTGLADDAVATPQAWLDQTPLDSAASAAVVAGAIADVMSFYPDKSAADAWAALQFMTNEASVVRSAVAADLHASGLQVLNLAWVGMPLADPSGANVPMYAGSSAAGEVVSRGGGRAPANSPSRVLIGPPPGGRRGPGNRDNPAGGGANGARVGAGSQNDRTVRGNTVPIGQSGRGGPR